MARHLRPIPLILQANSFSLGLAGNFGIVHPRDDVPGRVDERLVLGGILGGDSEQPSYKLVYGGQAQ